MDNDDRQVGRILSRREVLAILGSAGALMLVGCNSEQAGITQPTGAATRAATAVPTDGAAAVGTSTTAQCVVRPEETEGPYFVDEKINRSDIRSDPSDGAVSEGLPLALTFRVSQINNGCVPLAGATVDVWHCDALGVYSDATDRGFNTVGKKFLRGYQVTDANGVAQFTTIYPGWYQGRAVHVHFKIRTNNAAGQSYEFTSQLFFDELVTDLVHAQAPYASKGQRTLKNEGDGIYRSGGSQLLLPMVKRGQGYAGIFDIGLQVA